MKDNIVNRILKIYTILNEIFLERGILRENISSFNSDETLIYKINQFLDTGESAYVDFTIEDKYRTYVKFFLPWDSINKKKYIRTYKEVCNCIGHNYRNEVLFVMLNDELTDAQKQDIVILENMYTNLRIFHYKSLMYNITKHKLVPKHRIYNGDIDKLLMKLQIDNCNQLPVLNHQDPISKIYNFRPNDLVEILRPTLSCKFQKIYRIVTTDENILEEIENDSDIQREIDSEYTMDSILESINVDYNNNVNVIPKKILKDWLNYISIDTFGLDKLKELRILLYEQFKDSFTEPVNLEESEEEDKFVQGKQNVAQEEQSSEKSPTYQEWLEKEGYSPLKDLIIEDPIVDKSKDKLDNLPSESLEEEQLWECENDCGFKGSLIQVTEHEKTCKFISSKSS